MPHSVPAASFSCFRWLRSVADCGRRPGHLVDSFARFARKGLGTPAPVFPPRHLVVRGLYREVRNPMYLALAAVILGAGIRVWGCTGSPVRNSGLPGFPPVCRLSTKSRRCVAVLRRSTKNFAPRSGARFPASAHGSAASVVLSRAGLNQRFSGIRSSPTAAKSCPSESPCMRGF